MAPARAEGLFRSAELLRSSLPDGGDMLAATEDGWTRLLDHAERLHGPLPGARALDFVGAACGLRVRLERLPGLAAEPVSETDVMGLARDLGYELMEAGVLTAFAQDMVAGRVGADLTAVLRICTLLGLRPVLSEMADPAVLLWSAVDAPDAPEPDPAEAADLRRRVTVLLGRLTAREERVFRMRYGLGVDEHTLDEVGHALGVSGARIQQIENRALARLRSKAWEDGLGVYRYPAAAFSSVGAPLAPWPEPPGPATAALAARSGMTIGQIEAAFERTGAFAHVVGARRREIAVERIAEAVAAGHLPGTWSRTQVKAKLGCDDDTMDMLVARGLAPVLREETFGLGERFDRNLADRLLQRLFWRASLKLGPGRRPEREIVLRRAAATVGHSESEALCAALAEPSIVSGRDEGRSGVAAAVVDCDRLAEVLKASGVPPVGPDQRPWLLRDLAQAKAKAVRAKIDAETKNRKKAAKTRRPHDFAARLSARLAAADAEAWRLQMLRRAVQRAKKAAERAASTQAATVAKELRRHARDAARDLARTRRDVESARRLLERKLAAPPPMPVRPKRFARPAEELALLDVALKKLGIRDAGAQQNGRGLTVPQTCTRTRLPEAGVAWLIRTGRLRAESGNGRTRLNEVEVARFAREYVSAAEIERSWQAGRDIVDCLHLGNVPPVFPVGEIGVELFERNYVRKIADALGRH